MNIDYPELYYSIYPKVILAIDEHLDEKIFTEEITDKDIKDMIENIYIKLVKEYPEIDGDSYEKRRMRFRGKKNKFYGRSKIITDLISIILISELLRRR